MTKTSPPIAALAAIILWSLPAAWDGSISCGHLLAAGPDSNVLAECDFDPADTIIKVPVLIGAEPFRFGLALSKRSCFSTPFAKTLDRHSALLGVGERYSNELVYRSAPRSSIAGLNLQFPGDGVFCGALGSWIGAAYWSHGDGAIGLEVLAQHVVQIDFDNGKIRFLRSIDAAAGERLDITSFHKRPRRCAVTVKAQCCDGPAEDFYVELESPDAIYIRSPVYRRLLEKGMVRNFHLEETFGVDRLPFCFSGTAGSFTLGRFRTQDVRANVSGDNIIGLGYLSRYIVTFDFPRGFMYLRPGKRFTKADQHDVSGLRLGWEEDALIVRSTACSSPAEKAGLQEDDLILEVDGKTVNRKSRAVIWRQLRQQGSTVRVHVKRGDVIKEINVKLEATPATAVDDVDRKPGVDAPTPLHVPDLLPRGEPSELPTVVEPEDPKNATDERPLKWRAGAA